MCQTIKNLVRKKVINFFRYPKRNGKCFKYPTFYIGNWEFYIVYLEENGDSAGKHGNKVDEQERSWWERKIFFNLRCQICHIEGDYTDKGWTLCLKKLQFTHA